MRVRVLLESEDGKLYDALGNISDDPTEQDHKGGKTFTTYLDDRIDMIELVDDIKKLYQQIKHKQVNAR